MNKQKIKKFGFEFLTVFIGVFAAFALSNWNDKKKDDHTELKILSEINNGLKQDIRDININVEGHKSGLAATGFIRDLIFSHGAWHTKRISRFSFGNLITIKISKIICEKNVRPGSFSPTNISLTTFPDCVKLRLAK